MRAAVVCTGRELEQDVLLQLHRQFLAIYKSPPLVVLSERSAQSLQQLLALLVGLSGGAKQTSMPRTLSTFSYSISGKIICSLRPKA